MAGMTPIERAIMALWDDSYNMKRIATTLGVTVDRVRRTVEYYHGRDDERRHRIAMINGCADLLQAIESARAIA